MASAAPRSRTSMCLRSRCSRTLAGWGDLVSNPFELVDAPRRKSKPVNSMNAHEVARLNGALAGFGSSPLAVAVRIALSTGMRQGEIRALRWYDVDLDEKVHPSHPLTYALRRQVRARHPEDGELSAERALRRRTPLCVGETKARDDGGQGGVWAGMGRVPVRGGGGGGGWAGDGGPFSWGGGGGGGGGTGGAPPVFLGVWAPRGAPPSQPNTLS